MAGFFVADRGKYGVDLEVALQRPMHRATIGDLEQAPALFGRQVALQCHYTTNSFDLSRGICTVCTVVGMYPVMA